MRVIWVVAVTLFSLQSWAKPSVDVIRSTTAAELSKTEKLYKWFHQNPELSDAEKNTAKKLATELRSIGLEVFEGIGGHGVVGILRGQGKGKGRVVLYRADMDGLPVVERTGLSYASRNPGVMHACGHDVHMAVALGAIRVLKALERDWAGTLIFVGQPAEEIGKGARMMLADPRFKKILKKVGRPSLAVALHDAADLPAGQVSMRSGFVNANVDSVDIIVRGKGGHGARPHEAIDPVVIGAEIVMSLQTIVSRRLPAGTKAVVTVGKFAAGTKHNIIPPSAELLLTVRSYEDGVRNKLLSQIRRTAIQVARAHGATQDPLIKVRDEYTPAAYNDPTWTKKLRATFTSALGAKSVHEHGPSLGGEDFGRFSRTLKIPGVMWKLGTVKASVYRRTRGKGLPGLHSDKFAPAPGPTLRTGMLTATLAIVEGLSQP
jgi:hippurate hydrolase